jgi:hypothetical protein
VEHERHLVDAADVERAEMTASTATFEKSAIFSFTSRA